MRYFIDNLRNRFDFFLRNKITFSRKNYNEKSEDLSGLVSTEEQILLYNSLKQKYNYELLEDSTRRNFLGNVYFLNIFDKYFSKRNLKTTSILDIGSKNWAYVKSEYVFFQSFAERFILKGIELDAYRMYSNFYNRYEIAKFYTKDLVDTNYIAGDFLKHNQKYDYMVWSLPFITEYPLVKWGIPLNYFKPLDMLSHAYNLLNQDGELLIINQGEEEYNIQKELNQRLDLKAEYYGEIEDAFKLFKNKRYCSKIIK